MAQQNRDYLYGKFQQGAKPSEQDFRDLIDSTLNFQDDQIKRKDQELKVAAPLRVTTNPDDTEETLLKFYAGEENTWSINQKSGEDKVGFNISDANGASRLFIESEDGNVGIGTTEPSAPLQVIATKEIDPSKNGLYIYNSNKEKDQHAILSVRVAGKEGGKPFISWDVEGESGWSMGIDNQDENKLKIAPNWADLTNSTLMTFDGQGRVGIGTTEPEAPLQVTATKTSDPNPANNGLCIYNPNKEKDQHAILGLRVAGKEGGNPFISWDVANESGWSMGIDNQDENKLKIAPNWANLTDHTLMTFGQGRVDINGNLTIGADLNIGGNIRQPNNKKLIEVKRIEGIKGAENHNTHYSDSEWICGIIGFQSGNGDINEGANDKIIQMHTFIKDGTWHIYADFVSHNHHEDWTIWLMAISKKVADFV
ncbi:MAG: hypothetical protein F6J96_12670 [Symploca sp. SIO1C2]|nr:hypothetical protein [Symploca sp. SIO1C2]